MRLHAFGSLYDFVMIMFCVSLDNCLMRFDFGFAVTRFFPAEISCFLLHILF
jgi:hypothetical protein